MASFTCPFCRQTFHDVPNAEGPCPVCGQCLKATPTIPPYIVNGVNMRVVAQRQRRLLWLVLGAVLGQVLYFTMLPLLIQPVGSAVHPVVSAALTFFLLALHILIAVGVVLMMMATRSHIVIVILYAILGFAPCFNLVILLAANSRATRTLRKAGLHVGFMGVKDEEVVRLLSFNRCRQCGYNLTGNVSGRCPECGKDIPRAIPVEPAII